MGERFLVTGATGCIGAWTVRNLIREGVYTCALVRSSSVHRLKLIMSEKELAAVEFVSGDITDLNAVEHALSGHKITHIIHLAAMQFPFCKADPPLGAAVNVQGTVNIFEAGAAAYAAWSMPAAQLFTARAKNIPPGRWRTKRRSSRVHTMEFTSRPTRERRAYTGWITAFQASGYVLMWSTAPGGTRA